MPLIYWFFLLKAKINREKQYKNIRKNINNTGYSTFIMILMIALDKGIVREIGERNSRD